MRRIGVISFFALLSCMPGACPQKMGEKMAEKTVEKAIEKAIERDVKMQTGSKAKVDIGGTKVGGKIKNYVPPSFNAVITVEKEDGFYVQGTVKGMSVDDIERFYVSKFGKPDARITGMGYNLVLIWDKRELAVAVTKGDDKLTLIVGKGSERMF